MTKETDTTGDLRTEAEVTWCPGCGNFGVATALVRSVADLERRGVGRDDLFMCAGIGQHAKIFDYIDLSGFYSLHGRSMATAQGVKLANPALKVIDFVGDGDAMGEGLAHMMFAAKRNADITVVMHDNGIYALTTGQRAPTSAKGYRGPSTPRGSTEEPFNPMVLMLEAGATFVARSYSAATEELSGIIVEAVLHEGFSFVDLLQPCVTFNNTYERFNDELTPLPGTPETFDEALAAARAPAPLKTGIFYRADRETQERGLLEGRSPVGDRPGRADRRAVIARLLAG